MSLKGGVLDITDSARSILRDWRVGKFPYYTSPPGPANVEGLSADDEKVLGNIHSRKEMRTHPGLIRLSSGTVDSRSVVLDAPLPAPARNVEPLVPVNPTTTARSLADAEASDEEVETSSEDGENDNERGGESKSVHSASSKRKRAAAKTEGGRPAKKVTFAAKKSDKTAAVAAKVAPRKVSNTRKGVAKVAAASGDSDAYDFGQYF
jgi:nuclear GTP-binding protein